MSSELPKFDENPHLFYLVSNSCCIGVAKKYCLVKRARQGKCLKYFSSEYLHITVLEHEGAC